MNEARPELVETYDYNQHFIEVEVYKMANDRFHAWPYIGQRSSTGMTKHHFLLSKEDFSTKEEALRLAVKEGQQKIDGGFVVGQFG
jgi:hypothetical protein